MSFLNKLSPATRLRVKTVSMLRSADDLTPARVDGIINASLALLAEKAVAGLDDNIVIRDLRPSDFSGPTNDVWGVEVSSSSIGYATTALGDDTQIADDTYIAIWGVRFPTPATTETAATTYPTDLEPVISGIRITVGSSIVALWDLYSITHIISIDQSESITFKPTLGITESPIIITPRQKLKIEEYSVKAVADEYSLWFEGAVAEKVGPNISPPA